MKVLELARAFYPSIGGQEDVVARLVKGLSKKIDVELVVTDFNARKVPKFEKIDGVKVTRLRQFSRYNITPGLFNVLTQKDYDLLHVHAFGRFYTDFSAIFAKLAGKKIVLTPHGIYHTRKAKFFKDVYFAVFARFFLSKFDKIIAFTNVEKQFWVKDFGLDPKRIAVIPHSIASDFTNYKAGGLLKRLNLQPDYLLYLGRLESNKRVDLLVRAMKSVDCKLVIAGGGDWSKLKELVEKESLLDKVVFAGFVSDDEKKELLDNCLSLVLPTEYESFGIVILEAFAFGKPVFCSNLPILRELVSEGKTGFSFENNVGSMSEVIRANLKHVLANRKKFYSRSKAAANNYSDDLNVARHLAVFEKLLMR